MATLGAQLGCEQYLASTVVTGSRQRSSTFLAELCLSSILVLALRAFHCRPRRKKRARCPARVTSRMVNCRRFMSSMGDFLPYALSARRPTRAVGFPAPEPATEMPANPWGRPELF